MVLQALQQPVTPKHTILTDPKNAKASSQATSPAATAPKASSIRDSLEVVATSGGVLEGEAHDTTDDVKRRRMQDMLSKLADRYEQQAVEAIKTANNNEKYRVTAEAKAKSDKMKASSPT